MLQIIPERDFPCASKFVALDGCVVRCFFVCVRFVSSAPALVLRFLDSFSLFDMAPAELKYESIGSSPEMDGRGLMEVHSENGQLRLVNSRSGALTTTRGRVIDAFQ